LLLLGVAAIAISPFSEVVGAAIAGFFGRFERARRKRAYLSRRRAHS
jgi:hypothetical protein